MFEHSAPAGDQQMAAFIAHEHKAQQNSKAIKGTSDGPKAKGKVYTALGVAYLQSGHPRQAIRELRNATHADPDAAPAYNAMGLAYQQLDQAALAQSAFEHAISIDTKNPSYHNNYGAFLVHIGKYKEALRQLHVAITDPLYSTPQFAWTNMAQAYLNMHKPQSARNALHRALYLLPNYPPAMEILAGMDFKAGDIVAASSHIHTVLEQEPNNAGALLLAGNIAEKQGLNQNAVQLWTRCVNASPYSGYGREAQSLLLEHAS